MRKTRCRRGDRAGRLAPASSGGCLRPDTWTDTAENRRVPHDSLNLAGRTNMLERIENRVQLVLELPRPTTGLALRAVRLRTDRYPVKIATCFTDRAYPPERATRDHLPRRATPARRRGPWSIGLRTSRRRLGAQSVFRFVVVDSKDDVWRRGLVFDNDPSAGSPTETLLRLLLPLDNQV